MKKFKYSALCKIICVFICLSTFIGASSIATLFVMSSMNSVYDETSKADDWTNQTSFYTTFLENTLSLANDLTSDYVVKDAEKYLLENKDKILDEAYKQVIENKSLSKYTVDEDEYEDIDDDAVETTTYFEHDENIGGYYDVFIKDSYVGEICICPDETKKSIEKVFNDNYKQWALNYADQFSRDGQRYFNNQFNVYAKIDDKVIKNYSGDLNMNDYDIYFASKHGKLTYKGINSAVAQNVHSSLIDEYSHCKDADIYLFIQYADLESTSNVASLLKGNYSSFSSIYRFYNTSKKLNNNSIALFVLLALISLFSGFFYFFITGKKSKEEKASLAFYDYVPIDLAVCIASGLGFFAFWLAGITNDNLTRYTIGINIISYWITVAFSIACWLLLFILTSSNFRFFNSGKEVKKHFALYWLGVGIIKAFKWISQSLKKLALKLKQSARKTFIAFSYKPTKFKVNVIAITILWFIVNLALMLVSGVCVIDAPIISIILWILIFIANIFIIRRACVYIKNLDLIIDASQKHEEPNVDEQSLDDTLKILVDGIQYSKAELNKAVQKAIKDERMRTELITNVSHDLKTPLTSIINYVDLLKNCNIDDENAREYIAVLDEKGIKLKRLIDDLIEASKVTSGVIILNPVTLDLGELSTQAIVEHQQEFIDNGLELIFKGDKKNLQAYADGNKTFRIIENLLSNAKKYSAKGSRVYADIYDENGYSVFEIKNISAQPLDITADELKERFVRGDKSRTNEGNGLGLSIADSLCKAMNGKLDLIIDGDLFKARILLPRAK